MFVFHTNKNNALSLETFGFYGIDPEASLEEFFRLNSHLRVLGQYLKIFPPAITCLVVSSKVARCPVRKPAVTMISAMEWL